MPPPVPQITSSTSSSSLIQSPDSHSSSGSSNPNPNSMGIKRESMTINTMNEDLVSVPASHYGLVSLQIAAAVKKAQQISEKRCANSTSHLYPKAHITNTVVNNNNHETQTQAGVVGINLVGGIGVAGVEIHGKHIENGNNSTATITTTSTNNNFVRRYSDDYFAKDDIPSGSHLHHQQVHLRHFVVMKVFFSFQNFLFNLRFQSLLNWFNFLCFPLWMSSNQISAENLTKSTNSKSNLVTIPPATLTRSHHQW